MNEADIEYMTMGRLHLKNTPLVTVQASKTRPAHYRVIYENNSRKFETLADAMLFLHDHWGCDIIGKPREIWTYTWYLNTNWKK